MRPFVPLALRFVFLALLALPSLALGQWAGEERDVDGVVHVHNPAEPMLPPVTVQLEELFRLGGWDGEEFFGVIGDVMVDEQAGEIYVLDAQLSEIQVYDLSGAYLRTIGREGEGPGEFRRPADIALLPSGVIGVVQPWPSKMVLLTPEGDPAGDFSFEPRGEGFAGLSAVRTLGDRLALVYSVSQPDRDAGEFRRTLRLGVFEESGQEVAELTSVTSAMQFSNQTVVERDWNHFDQAWAASPDGRVFARDDFRAYRIDVWNADGTPDRVIHREYAPHARTDEDIDEIRNRWAARIARWVRDPGFEIEENWNPIEDLFAREDGTLWVRTSRGMRETDEGTLARFDVFDSQGRYERQVVLPGSFDPENDGLFLSGAHVIVVTDLVSARDALMGGMGGAEEDEDAAPMEIIVHRMDTAAVARAPEAGR